jgi:plasmid stabilization system protein ParE
MDDEGGEDELQDDPDRHHPPGDIFAVGAEQDGDAEKDRYAEETTTKIEEIFHGARAGKKNRETLSDRRRGCRAAPACALASHVDACRSVCRPRSCWISSSSLFFS